MCPNKNVEHMKSSWFMISILWTRISNRVISTEVIENICFVSHICALVRLQWLQDKLKKNINHHSCAATYWPTEYWSKTESQTIDIKQMPKGLWGLEIGFDGINLYWFRKDNQWTHWDDIYDREY